MTVRSRVFIRLFLFLFFFFLLAPSSYALTQQVIFRAIDQNGTEVAGAEIEVLGLGTVTSGESLGVAENSDISYRGQVSYLIKGDYISAHITAGTTELVYPYRRVLLETVDEDGAAITLADGKVDIISLDSYPAGTLISLPQTSTIEYRSRFKCCLVGAVRSKVITPDLTELKALFISLLVNAKDENGMIVSNALIDVYQVGSFPAGSYVTVPDGISMLYKTTLGSIWNTPYLSVNIDSNVSDVTYPYQSAQFNAVDENGAAVDGAEIYINEYGTVANGETVILPQGYSARYKGKMNSVYGSYIEGTVEEGVTSYSVPFRNLLVKTTNQYGSDLAGTQLQINGYGYVNGGDAIALPEGAGLNIKGFIGNFQGDFISRDILATDTEISYPYITANFRAVDQNGNDRADARIDVYGYGLVESGSSLSFPSGQTIQYRGKAVAPDGVSFSPLAGPYESALMNDAVTDLVYPFRSVLMSAIDQNGNAVNGMDITVAYHGTVLSGTRLTFPEGSSFEYRGSVKYFYGAYLAADITATTDEVSYPFREVAFIVRNYANVDLLGATMKIDNFGEVENHGKRLFPGDYDITYNAVYEGVNYNSQGATLTEQVTEIVATIPVDSNDTTAPVISINSPVDQGWSNAAALTVNGTVNEPLYSLTVDGIAVIPVENSFSLAGVALGEGVNVITVNAVDWAGNPATATVTVNRDSVAPVVAITSHADNTYLNTPVISVSGTVNETNLQSVMINGLATEITEGTETSFSLASLSLTEGANVITVVATDKAGNSATSTLTINLDTAPPVLNITSNADNSYVNTPAISVSGTVNETNLQSVMINGFATEVTEGTETSFSLASLSLTEGANVLNVTATDLAGNVGTSSIVINLDTAAPVVAVTSHADNSYVNTPAISVSGTVNETNLQSVMINGFATEVTEGTETSFSLASLSLTEGANVITVVATDKAGNSATSTLTINLDTAPPVLNITSNADNSYVNTPAISVSGTVNETNLQSVMINGFATEVTEGTETSFSLASLSLTEGANTITVVATDLAGNTGTALLTLNLDTAPPVVTINAPVNGALLSLDAISVSGMVSEPVSNLTVNGLATEVTENTEVIFNLASLSLIEGANTITATATDLAGNSGSATVSVTRDATPPVAPVITAPASPTNVSTLTLGGTAEAGTTVTIEQTVDGVSSTAGSATADAAGAFNIAAITLFEGTNSFSAVATDNAGNSSAASVSVAITLDTAPPVITVTEPLDNAYSNVPDVIVSGALNEAAVLTINGATVPLNSYSFSHSLTFDTEVNIITLTATDPAGNVATLTRTVNVILRTPEVTITSPVDGFVTNASAVTVTGSVDMSVDSVTVNGSATEITAGAETTFSLAGLNLTEGANTITATANVGGASGTATVTVTRDSQPPLINITAPAGALAGDRVVLSIAASDSLSLGSIQVSVNGGLLWSATPENSLSLNDTVAYSLSPTLAEGDSLLIEAIVFDSAGNSATATATLPITGVAEGPGYLQGEVYDDSKGLLFAGASIKISAIDTVFTADIEGGGDGSFFVELQPGSYHVSISAPGFTTVERTVLIKSGVRSIVLDSRITPLNDTQKYVGPEGGMVTVGELASLTLPANALEGFADLRLTTLSNQGLAGILPRGWSPVALINVHEIAGDGAIVDRLDFANSATVNITHSAALYPSGTLAPSQAVTFAGWDKANHRWSVLTPGVVSSDGAILSADIISTGQYAFLLPDPCEGVDCPLALPGAELPAYATGAAPAFADLTVTGRVVPSAAPPTEGLKSTGEVVINHSDGITTFTSGLVLVAAVTERFDLLSGETVLPAQFEQDIINYSYRCLTNDNPAVPEGTDESAALVATFPVSPSRQYTLIDLMLGKVGVNMSLPDLGERGVMMGTTGGRLADDDGNLLVIGAGGLTKTVPVEAETANAADLEALIPADMALIRAVNIDLSGEVLSSTAELSIPLPDGFDVSHPVLVARLFEADGKRRLQVVATGRVTGGLITSTTENMSNAAGIVRSGTYLFIEASRAVGFMTGIVNGLNGSAFAGALATVDGSAIADISHADGSYLLAALSGPWTARAMDLTTRNEAIATGAINTNREVTTQNLNIISTPPRVVAISPTDGATGVDDKTAIIVTFSEPIAKATAIDGVITLTDASGENITGVLSLGADGKTLSFYASKLLASETAHTVVVAGTIQDMQGLAMGSSFTSTFTVKDTTPPPAPPAGSITASFPDADGYIDITASPGTVEAGAAVLIINDDTGMIVGISPLNDGSFTARIQATLGDVIRVVLMDDAGNETLISYITFKTDDGRYMVTRQGGVVEGEGGIKLEIPAGSLIAPSIVKVTPMLESELLHPIPAEAIFIGAVNIDAGNAYFKGEIDLSIPVPADLPEGVEPFVAAPRVLVNPDGIEEKVYEILDSTKIIDGRITTASPPFLGIYGVVGAVAFVYVDDPLGGQVTLSGYAYQDMDGVDGYQPGETENNDKPVKNAIIRCPSAENFISYTKSDGYYATYAFTAKSMCRSYTITGIHPLTMFRDTQDLVDCDAPYLASDVNFKLADKDTKIPDTSAPVISAKILVVPGQDVTNIFGGAVPVNTELTVSIDVIDQELKSEPSLTVNYESEDGSQKEKYSGIVNLADKSLYKAISENNPVPLYKYDYSIIFNSPIVGSEGTFFNSTSAGTYKFEITAEDAAGLTDTRIIQVRTVKDAELPETLDGYPAVDFTLPAANDANVMVTMPIEVTFNERVLNVNTDTIKLIELSSNTEVPAIVYPAFEGGRMKAILAPKNSLLYDNDYEIVVTTGITDAVANPSYGDVLLNLQSEYKAHFATKVPIVHNFESPQFTEGRDIAVYEHPNGRDYAYIAAGNKGWHVVDITNPAMPEKVYSFQPSAEFSFRGIAVDHESGILAITDTVNIYGGGQFGYVRFYDISENPEKPVKIGQERLAEDWSGIPYRVALYDGHAYVVTVMAGLHVVNINAAKSYSEASRGASITYLYNSSEMGYGQPSEINVYGNGRAMLTTAKGHLIIFDLANPGMPMETGNLVPTDTYNVFRAAAAANFKYNDEEGMTQLMDIAVTSSRTGGVHTVSLANPFNPQVIATVRKKDGSELICQATDITISEEIGLAFIASNGAVYVVDIKDPYNPVLLNEIVDAQSGDLNGLSQMLGFTQALIEKDGYLYMASADAGMKVLDVGSAALQMGLTPLADTWVSADEATVQITAYIKDMPADLKDKPLSVMWRKEGDGGTLSEAISTSTDGIFSTTLTTSRIAGSTYEVRPLLIKEDGTAENLGITTGLITVEAGTAATLEFTSTRSSIAADKLTQATIEVTAKDAYNNLVKDDTSIHWELEGDATFATVDPTTVGGKASVTVRAGGFPGIQNLRAYVDGTTQTYELDQREIDIVLTSGAGSLVAGGDSTVINVSVTSTAEGGVADGAEVEFFSTLGKVIGSGAVSSGATSATFNTRDLIGTAQITGNIGNSYGKTLVDITPPEGLHVSFDQKIIVGNESVDGTITEEGLNGPVTISYPTSSMMRVQGGIPGATIQVRLDHNIEPVAWYLMNGLGNNVVWDIYHDHHGTAEGVTVDELNFKRGAGSFEFDGLAKVEIPDADALHINSLAFDVDVRPGAGAESQTLIRKDGSYLFSLVKDGTTTRAQFQVETDTDSYSITSTAPLMQGEWNKLYVSVQDGELLVRVNNIENSIPVEGNIVYTDSSIIAGENYTGNMDNLQIIDLTRSKLTNFANGTDFLETTLDANGTALIPISSTGFLRTHSSNLWLVEAKVYYKDVMDAPESGLLAMISSSLAWHTVNVVNSAVFGEVEGVDGAVADIAASVVLYGDLRDIALIGPKVWFGFSNTGDEIILSFAALGVVTTAFPIADPFVATIKVAAKLMKGSEIVTGLGLIKKRLVQSDSVDAVTKVVNDYKDIISRIISDSGFRDFLMTAFPRGRSLDLEEAGNWFDTLAKFERTAGKNNPDLLSNLFNSIQTKYGNVPGVDAKLVARNTIESVSRLTAKLEKYNVALNGEAIEGISTLMRYAKDPAKAEQIFDAIVLRNELVADMATKELALNNFFTLLKKGEAHDLPGFDTLVKTCCNTRGHVIGTDFELKILDKAATEIGFTGPNAGLEAATGIGKRRADAVADGFYIEGKNRAKNVMHKSDWDQFEDYINMYRDFYLERDVTKLRYLFRDAESAGGKEIKAEMLRRAEAVLGISDEGKVLFEKFKNNIDNIVKFQGEETDALFIGTLKDII